MTPSVRSCYDDLQNRSFTFTPAGEYFYKKSLILTSDLEKLCRETARIAHKDEARLRIGYLKCYSGLEFQMAVAEFSEKYPDIMIDIINGNHEDLYDVLYPGRLPGSAGK